MGCRCSVENLYSDNHYVMRDSPQDDLTELIRLDPRAERRAESPLDHRVHGLHLPPLTILGLEPGESLSHHAPPPPRGRLLRRTAARRRDDRPHPVRADRLVQPLGVEVSVGQEHLDPGAPRRLTPRPPELNQVGRRPTAGDRRQDHVALAVDHEDDLREVGVSPVPVGVPVRLPLREVAADVARLQACAVDRRQGDATLPHPVLQCPVEHGVEHPAAGDRRQESLRGLLKGGEVGDGLQVDQRAEVGVVGEVRGQPPVVEARELLERQARHELVLGELLGAELVPVRGERLAGRLVGDLEHPARRFAGLHTS